MRCYKMKLKCEYIPIGQHKLASSSTFEASTPSPTTPDMPFRADLYNTSPSGQWVTPAGGGDQVFVAQPAATGVPALAYEQHATAPFASGTGSRRISANYSTAPPWVSASLPARSYSPAPAHPAYALAGPGERPEAWMGTRLSYPVSQSTPSSPTAEERGYPPGQQAVEGGLAHWRQQPPAASQWREGASAGTLGGTGAALQTAYPARVDPSPATQQYYPHTGWT